MNNRFGLRIETKRLLAAWTLYASLAVTIGVTLAAVVARVLGKDMTTLSPLVQYAPFVLSIVLFGLPHGAIDHLVPSRLRGQPANLKMILAVALGYVTLAGCYLLVWFVAPVASFVFFILLTWFHWGQGDLYALLALTDANYIRTKRHKALTIFVRGGLPMLIPLVAFPNEYRRVAESLTAIFGTNSVESVSLVFTLPFRVSAGLVFACGTLLTLRIGDKRSATIKARGAWRSDAVEVLLLVLYFTVVPPVLAVGLYFCFWHSTRHIARLVLLERNSLVAQHKQNPLFVLRRFAIDATPMTLGALAIFGGFYLLAPQDNLSALVALYLVLISVLTLPHVLIVTWMDAEQGVWTTARANA